MRVISVLLVSSALSGFTALVSAQSATDKAVVRLAAKRILDTFNAHDMEANIALDDEVYESWEGTVRGPDEDLKSQRELFARHKNLQRTLTQEIGIVFVTPDVAIYKLRGQWTGWIGEDGNTLPPAEFMHAMVLVKRDGDWKLAAGFNRMQQD